VCCRGGALALLWRRSVWQRGLAFSQWPALAAAWQQSVAAGIGTVDSVWAPLADVDWARLDSNQGPRDYEKSGLSNPCWPSMTYMRHQAVCKKVCK